MEVVPGLSATGNGSTEFYLVTSAAALTGRDITNARPTMDELGLPAVDATLSPDGVTKFARLTGENIGRQLAIIVDGRVVSAPAIRERVSAPFVRITGTFTKQEAGDLALILTAGALPASITFIAEGREK